MDELDALIVDALRTAPLEAPPPGLFQAVMGEVAHHRRAPLPARPAPAAGRRAPLPARLSFHVTWLDLALSLFGAGLLGMAWLAWSALSPQWAGYYRMLAVWMVQRAWYDERGVLAWLLFALAVLCAGLLAAGLSCVRLGICSRRI